MGRDFSQRHCTMRITQPPDERVQELEILLQATLIQAEAYWVETEQAKTEVGC